MTTHRRLDSWSDSWDVYTAELDAYDDDTPDALLDVEDAFAEHDIEYWVRRGNRLVPATAADIACIQESTRQRATQRRLWSDKRVEQQQTLKNPLLVLRRLIRAISQRVSRDP